MPQAGDPIRASDIPITRFVQKTVTENVTSSTTMQDDDELFMTIDVGLWRIEAIIGVTGQTAADIKLGWTFSGTASGLSRQILGSPTTLADPTDANMRYTSHGLTTALGYGTVTTPAAWIREDITLEVSVAGILRLQWAQLASNASPSSVIAASKIYVSELEQA
jgi:hypothetical protein